MRLHKILFTAMAIMVCLSLTTLQTNSYLQLNTRTKSNFTSYSSIARANYSPLTTNQKNTIETSPTRPEPTPTPSPDPNPYAERYPLGQPVPTPEPQPVPAPIPQPVPTPIPQPVPTPEPQPIPEPK